MLTSLYIAGWFLIGSLAYILIARLLDGEWPTRGEVLLASFIGPVNLIILFVELILITITRVTKIREFLAKRIL